MLYKQENTFLDHAGGDDRMSEGALSAFFVEMAKASMVSLSRSILTVAAEGQKLTVDHACGSRQT